MTRRERKGHRTRTTRSTSRAVWIGVLAMVTLIGWRFWPAPPLPRSAASSPPLAQTTPDVVIRSPFSAEQLQGAADALLASADTRRPENQSLPVYAREKLAWMMDEHRAGRLQVGFYEETAAQRLPSDVLMMAWRADGVSTIFIGRPRFAKFLQEGGATAETFTPQQKTDFALALVHEVVHLQRWVAPGSPAQRVREESQVWRDVTVNVVRPLRALNRPVDRRFILVDDAFRSCDDQVPCAPIARLVRLTQ